MTRDDEAALIEFCYAQRRAFDASQWCAGGGITSNLLAAAALFLANTQWYGKSDELRAIAARLAPGATFPALSTQEGMSPSRFGAMVRERIQS